MSKTNAPAGPNFTAGVPVSDLDEGEPLLGHVGEDGVILVRRGEDVHAVSAKCTHYGGPLAKGLVVGDTVRCPYHHACFSLRNGEVLNAPGMAPLPCWEVERAGDTVRVARKKPATERGAWQANQHDLPEKIVIVGAGAAGNTAAEALRWHGYTGAITLLDAGPDLPPDRPNLSKDYLAGDAPEEWVPLRGEGDYKKRDIELLRNARVKSIDTKQHHVHLDDGTELAYDKLLLATGADPVKLPIPGADAKHVHTLRSTGDSRAIIAAIEAGAKRAVVIGASFIGLEVAASLIKRKLEVHVVAPEDIPLARVFGERLGRFIRELHESKGVHFHLGHGVKGIDTDIVELDDGSRLAADLIVIGVGVRPAIALAKDAGLEVDNGVVVDAYLRTSDPDIYAAGDIAAWPDDATGERLRVEHWAVAEQQGRVAARNLLGAGETYHQVPFFWSQHYDVSINYVGHATHWDRIEEDGDPDKHDCAFSYYLNDKHLAVASIFRDRYSLEVEAEMAAKRTG
ncbi:MAG: FAD-dependent oxidoreductase [Gammaproteobacteria bacterium]